MVEILMENPGNPGNIGSTMRNLYAFDIGELLLPDRKFHLKAIKNCSCGTNQFVMQKTIPDIQKFLSETKSRKLGFIVDETAIPIWNFPFKDDDLLIFGNEKTGLTEETIEQCDSLLTIPMFGYKACLNVSTAIGITLYEIIRQRLDVK